jgi:DNA topoisomerase-2
MVKKKTIEETYRSMDEITHILSRPGMYVGSNGEETRQMYLYDRAAGRMGLEEVTYVPALLKIFDEVLSNSCDEFRRKTNLGLTQVDVTVEPDTDTVTVRDDGGIPVVMHREAGCYVPEFIFGRLRTSSNYDDTEDRSVIGTNGVGSALCNVFSKEFRIDTCDGKNRYRRTWKDNMNTLCDDLKVTKTKEHFTETRFIPDMTRFETDGGLSDGFMRVMEKKCIDAAAANPGLTVTFTVKGGRSGEWTFKDFSSYIELYSDFIDTDTGVSCVCGTDRIWVYPTVQGGLTVGFVDGAECSGGTHVKAIRGPINQAVAEYVNKKEKTDLKPANVDGKYSVFCCMNVVNPSYDSQTKDTLTTPKERFHDGGFTLPDRFVQDVCRSELCGIMRDWYRQKTDVEDQAKLRKMNREAKKDFRSQKYIECNGRKAKDRQLWLFEGDSAKAGFRMARDPETQAAYLMRGVGLNTEGMGAVKIMQNREFSDMFNIIGLQWGDGFDPEKMNFGRIVICTDMDPDGSKIAAILMVFFNHFRGLLDSGRIVRAMSPIIIARKGKDKKVFYTMDEYHRHEKTLKGWSVRYIKGLAGLMPDDYSVMMRAPRFEVFTKDKMTDAMLQKWFRKGIASERKEMMKDMIEK